MADDTMVQARMAADLRWLAEARQEYLARSTTMSSATAALSEDVRVATAMADAMASPTMGVLASILDGDLEAARSWLPSWRWAEWDRRYAANCDAEAAEDAVLTAKCEAFTWSWNHYPVAAIRGYWIRCDERGPHETHENFDTELRWKS